MSSNGISGRIPLQLFGSLAKLKSLNLQDNGLDENFFIPCYSSNRSSTFASLESLDLSRNAIDSLEEIESTLGIPRERSVQYTGVASVSLMKAFATVQQPASSKYPPIHINLAQNFLREELPRRKKLRRGEKAQESVVTESEVSPDSASQKCSKQSVLSLLDDVYQRTRTRLLRGDLDETVLKQITASLESLNSTIAEERVGGAVEASAHHKVDRPSAGSGVVDASKQQSTPARPTLAELPGSSRARRQRLEEEAKQWAPL